VLGCVAAAVLQPASAAAVVAPVVVFRLSDPRIDEASGIAVGITSPGVVYVQNDSGDSARFFALDAHSGRTLAVYDVPGATNVDWEDIAVAPDAAGTPSLWLGDIGDNDAVRTQIEIYRVPEPKVSLDGNGATLSTGVPEVWRLRYPSGAVNAESLAVSPGGRAYLVTKSLTGSSSVYAVPPSSDGGRLQTLSRIGRITFGITGTANPFSVAGQLTATGAALSPDGTTLVVRTYSDAYFWRVGAGGVAAALTVAPVRIPLPDQPQGEGITFDGARVLIDSEHVDTAVYAVPLPAAITAAATATAPQSLAPAASPSSASSAAVSAAVSPVSAAPAASSPAPGSNKSTHSRSVGGLVALLVVAGAWALSMRWRRNRRARREDDGGV
jgi:hypothetical protein